MNDVPASKAQIFRFNSPGFNRSKYLALYTLRELESEGYPTDFKTLYVNSAIPYRGLVCALPRWIEWNYLYPVMKLGKKEYRLSPKGKRFLDKLDKIIPETGEWWLEERSEWRRMIPDTIEDWRRSALVSCLC